MLKEMYILCDRTVFLGPDFLSTLPDEILSRIVEDNRSDELMRHLLKMVKQNPSKALQGI